MSDFQRLMRELPNDNARDMVAVTQYEASKHKQLAAFPVFRYSNGAVLREFGMEQIYQVMPTFMALVLTPSRTFASKSGLRFYLAKGWLT